MFLIEEELKKLPGKPVSTLCMGKKMRSFMWERRSV